MRLADAQIATGRWDQAHKTLNALAVDHANRLSDDQNYRLVRRRGSIAFHREEHAAAIAAFAEGLAIATASEDVLRLGKSHNDLGAAYRAQGLYGEALEHLLMGLRYKRISGDPHAIATTLNNIGNVYRDMGECQSALDQYRNAISVFREALQKSDDQRSRLNIAHTQENVGLCHAALGQADLALTALTESLAQFEKFERYQDQIRLHISLARHYLQNDKKGLAQQQLNRARNLADRRSDALSMDYYELTFTLNMDRDSYREALDAARAGFDIAQAASNTGRQAEFSRAVADAYAAMGEYAQAYQWQVNHLDAIESAVEQRFNDEVAKNRTLYDLQLREDRIETLRKDIEIAELRERQWIALSAIVFLGAAGAVAIWALRRRRKQLELQRELDTHRHRAKMLEANSARLHQIIRATSEPIAVVDPSHRVDIINPAFAELCGLDPELVEGQPLAGIIPELAGSNRYAQLSEDEPRASVECTLLHKNNEPWIADLLLIESGRVVVSLRGQQSTAANLEQASLLGALQRLDHVRDEVRALLERIRRWRPGDHTPGDEITQELQDLSAKMDRIVSDTRVDDLDQQYRTALVTLMNGALEAWEAATGTGKIDLAEQSGIWRINIDDGRLRTRSMDRYFQLTRLPANPRWREVVRTAHFVLGNDDVEPATRERLASLLQRVETLQQAVD